MKRQHTPTDAEVEKGAKRLAMMFSPSGKCTQAVIDSHKASVRAALSFEVNDVKPA